MIALRNKHRRRMTDWQLVRAFERREFDAEDMTHRRCIRVGYVYVKHYGLAEAIIRMRAGLKAIAEAETGDTGFGRYCETWTFAWLTLIDATMQTYDPLPDSRAFFLKHSRKDFSNKARRMDGVGDYRCAKKPLPLRHSRPSRRPCRRYDARRVSAPRPIGAIV